jgi:hemerythrin-like metal-binding protein
MSISTPCEPPFTITSDIEVLLKRTAVPETPESTTRFAAWSDEFSTGLAELDCEHQRLFALLGELHGALKAGVDREALGKPLDEVMHYWCYHAAHEEELFVKTDYPGYEKHCRQHQALIAMIKEIRADFESGASEPLQQQVLEFLKNWLLEHVLQADRSFAVYLNTRRIAR